MFGGNELVLIIVAGLLIFGVRNAPRIGSSLGKSIQSFKRAAKGADEIDITPIASGKEEDEKGREQETGDAGGGQE